MLLEDRAAHLQDLKQEAGLDPRDPKDRLLSELCDTVSMLCHQVNLIGEVTDGVNETLDNFLTQLQMLEDDEEDVLDEGEIEDYFEGSEMPLYGVTCTECGDEFAVDEKSLIKGFSCPTCGARLIQAE